MNNPFKFPIGIENKLLKYVLIDKNKDEITPESILSKIDKFCWEIQWMMHIGDKKGKLLEDIIGKYNPKYVLELGTYCGYSTIRIANILTKLGKQGSIVYSVDSNTGSTSIANRFAKKVNLDKKIKFINGNAQQIIPKLKNDINKFDLIFIDHDKYRYLSDLKLLEKYKLVGKKTVIIANGVGALKINDYLEYINDKSKFDTKLYQIAVGYTCEEKNGNKNNKNSDKNSDKNNDIISVSQII